MNAGEESRIKCIITNQGLYDSKVKTVDYSKLVIVNNGEVSGQVYITTPDDGCKPFYGLYDLHDFEDEFGFVLELNN